MILAMCRIQNLSLNNFRNFENLEIKAGEGLNLVIGSNGSGKTTILESISLLSPGKGIRNTNFDDMIKYGNSEFTIRSSVKSNLGSFNIRAQYHRSRQGKSIYLEDEKISNSEMKKILSIIFLTPQMSDVFSSITERRKLLDRLVYYFDLEHSSRIHRYEYYLKERMKLLETSHYDQNWMTVIESKITESAILIASSRMHIISMLQSFINNMNTSFPKPVLDMNGYIEQKVMSENVENLKKSICEILYQNRSEDFATKRTNFGTHRSDFVVKFGQKNFRAEFCSTGEQKALLISIILAKTLATIEIFGKSPIILLDEAIAHLDQLRRDELITFLCGLKCQIWISATENKDFAKYKYNLIEL